MTVIKIHPLGNIHVCSEFNGCPSNSWWDISVWTKAVDRPTSRSILPSLEPCCWRGCKCWNHYSCKVVGLVLVSVLSQALSKLKDLYWERTRTHIYIHTHTHTQGKVFVSVCLWSVCACRCAAIVSLSEPTVCVSECVCSHSKIVPQETAHIQLFTQESN